MKYFFVPFLLLILASCTPSGSVNDSESVTPNINVGWVQLSDLGVSVSNENGNVSVGSDGTVLMQSGSGNISAGADGANIVSGDSSISVGTNGSVSVGTGINIPSMSDLEKDPEIQSITQDIENIFSDIEGEE